MKFISLLKRTIFVCSLMLFVSGISFGQNVKSEIPEISVAGIKLGNRESAKAFLTNVGPRIGEKGEAEYYFYNKFGTQVMKLVAADFNDPHFITEIEVFAVGRSYQKPHFVLDDQGYFVTENGIFIGYRQSAGSMVVGMMIGIPGVSREDMIGPKDVIRKKGQPTTKTVTENKRDVFTYEVHDTESFINNLETQNLDNKYGYAARYEFNKNKLKRFSIKLTSNLTARK